jgi:hypothetical protein
MDMEVTLLQVLLQQLGIQMKVKTSGQKCSLYLDKTKSLEETTWEYSNEILQDLEWWVHKLDQQHAHHHRHQIILIKLRVHTAMIKTTVCTELLIVKVAV